MFNPTHKLERGCGGCGKPRSKGKSKSKTSSKKPKPSAIMKPKRRGW